jgi:putative Mg2+ transporter-C (MgtC) family protein
MENSDFSGIILPFLAALLLGGIIGVEREQARRSAGCRTFMLVCGSAAIFVGMGDILLHGFKESGVSDMVKADPIRLVQAVIIGLGFIGGGIMKQSEDIHHNLSTAAAFIVTAAIGFYCGLRHFAVAAVLTVTTVAILHILGKIEKRSRWFGGDRKE